MISFQFYSQIEQYLLLVFNCRKGIHRERSTRIYNVIYSYPIKERFYEFMESAVTINAVIVIESIKKSFKLIKKH